MSKLFSKQAEPEPQKPVAHLHQRPAAAAWKSLPQATRFSKRYRIGFWRDTEGAYHVFEELLASDGTVVFSKEIGEPEGWNATEAKLTDVAVEHLS